MARPPLSPDWQSANFPGAWPDAPRYSTLFGSLLLMVYAIASSLGRRRPVRVPKGLPGQEELPAYLLQEFHGMPNGYYSQRLADDYPRGFEIAMLGRMRGARQRMASQLRGRESVLELGAGAGLLLKELEAAGVRRVVGLDASAYNLKSAARAVGSSTLVQGLAEALPFDAEEFDGICACFLFHELPRAIASATFEECARVLRPGGLLVITEPSPAHLCTPVWRLLLSFNLRGLYYRGLAAAVHEPYLEDWLGRDLRASLAEVGLEIVDEHVAIPFHEIIARKVSGAG